MATTPSLAAFTADRNAASDAVLLHESTIAALADTFDLVAGDRILDVGCGTGRFVAALVDQGFDAIGLDDDAAETDRTFALSPAAGVPVEPASVRLAVVRGCDAFCDGLARPEAYVAMANVLSSLEAGGTVVVVSLESDAAASELLNRCGLASTSRTIAKPVGLIGRLLGKRANGPVVTAACIGDESLSKLELHAIARDAAMDVMQRAA